MNTRAVATCGFFGGAGLTGVQRAAIGASYGLISVAAAPPIFTGIKRAVMRYLTILAAYTPWGGRCF